MSKANRNQMTLSDEEIDEIVIAQANDESAWEESVQVHRGSSTALTIPADLAARAAFLARLHRKESLNEWLASVIQDRVELEEAAFFQAKQDLAAQIG